MCGSSLISMSRSSCRRNAVAFPGWRRRAASSTTAHQPAGLRAAQGLLALHQQFDATLDLGWLGPGVVEPQQSAGVIRGLQEVRDELSLVAADHAGTLFQFQPGPGRTGEQVAVVPPPASRVGLIDQHEQAVALRIVAHPVEGEQVGHVAPFEAAPPRLQAADLRVRPADRPSRVYARHPAGFPQLAQPSPQQHSHHGRPGQRRSHLVTRATGRMAGVRYPSSVPLLRSGPIEPAMVHSG